MSWMFLHLDQKVLDRSLRQTVLCVFFMFLLPTLWSIKPCFFSQPEPLLSFDIKQLLLSPQRASGSCITAALPSVCFLSPPLSDHPPFSPGCRKAGRRFAVTGRPLKVLQLLEARSPASLLCPRRNTLAVNPSMIQGALFLGRSTLEGGVYQENYSVNVHVQKVWVGALQRLQEQLEASNCMLTN